MEKKKSASADLEKRRPLFFQIGLLTSLSLSFIAFEWTSTHKVDDFHSKGTETMVWEYDYTRDIKIEEPKEKEIEKPTENVNKTLPPKIVPDDKVIEPDSEPKPDPNPVVKNPIVVPSMKTDTLPAEAYELWRLEVYPEFPGGESERVKWFVKNLKYPEIERNMKIEGRVFVKFVVNENGKITDVEGHGHSRALVKEAERVVSSMPDWKPGRMGTKNVSAQYSIPIDFKLK